MTDVAPLSADTAAILLLCGHFGEKPAGVKPLTPAEFHGFALWLEDKGLALGALVEGDPERVFQGRRDTPLSLDRVAALLGRADQLSQVMEKWLREGIWVISEKDADYPARLGDRLRSAGSPLLFGAGPRAVLGHGGVCIVGSRDSAKAGLAFARSLGAKCGSQDLTVVSGYMRGVNREAVAAALAAGGTAVYVLSDSLEKALAQKRNREALASGALSLVTPFSPGTRFSVANAMRSSKYQYALADVAVIVETRQHGGVWSGADENRNEGWVPAFVRAGEDMAPGNTALLHLGLRPITQEDVDGCQDIRDCFLARSSVSADSEGVDVPGSHPNLYAVFLTELESFAAAAPRTEAEIVDHFGLERAQARAWLKRAQGDGRIGKSGSPARYGPVRE